MSVQVNQVPMWLILDRNIGHALVQTKSGWNFIACGTFTPNGEITNRRPVRICSKCRAQLKVATLITSESGK